MIKLSVDEGAAFDILCISVIKLTKNPSNTQLNEVTKKIIFEVREEVGDEKFVKVLFSEEYSELFLANMSIYELIDSIKRHEKVGDAASIDALNHKRFIAKKKIQEQFFSSNLTEQKFGYQND